jgi:hypothetical protein
MLNVLKFFWVKYRHSKLVHVVFIYNIQENSHSLQKKLFSLEYGDEKASQSEVDTLLWLIG